MSNYWKNRAVNLENLIQEKTDEAIIKINELYSNSVKTINGHIEKIFNTYKNGGKIDREYALQLLSAGQTEKQRQELLEKLSKTTDKTAKQKIINILNAPAYADRISRLQALKDMVRAEAVTLGVNESDITTDNLINTSKESYYRTLYNDQIQCGKAYDFNTLSDKRLKAMLSQKWSGKNYSSRIWKNNDDFINRLEQTLEMGCLTGLSINEMEDVILNDCIGATSNEAQRFCASRLIRTETNHFANQGILMGYQQAGIERYRFLATLDIHTSKKCRSLDSKVFLVSEAETGVNLPPMHPFCRSVTVPDTASRNGTRWARDPVTGKSITVPADMTYSEWYDKYVKDNPEAFKKEHVTKNTLSDKVQYERYKKILGNKVPETLEEFVDIKYNDDNKWDELKSLSKSKNYLQNQLAYILDTGEKNFIPTHTKFDTTPKVIAGVGTDNPIRVVDKLINLYGGSEKDWQKKVVRIKSEKYIFDVHWYEYDGIQYEMKLKHRKERR